MVEFLDNRKTAYDTFIGRWTFRLFIFWGVKYKPHYVKENLQWKHFEKIPPPPLFGESQKNLSFLVQSGFPKEEDDKNEPGNPSHLASS